MTENSAPMRLIADRYQILSEIGRGGMGIVFLAEDGRIGRKVALKQLHLGSDVMGADEAVQRFMREARLTGQLHHPNIVTLFDVVEEGEDLFLVLEYYKSRSLGDIVDAEGALDEEQVRELGAELAAALDAAHAEGVIHRDIKPDNILVGQKGAKLTDFGIARIAEGAQGAPSRITKTGFYVGTAGYMAPEQLTDHPATPLSDVFSVGAVLCYCLLGRDPFGDGPLPSIVYKIVNEDIDLSEVVCSGELKALLSRVTAKSPGDRPSAAELADLITSRNEATTGHTPDPAASFEPAPQPVAAPAASFESAYQSVDAPAAPFDSAYQSVAAPSKRRMWPKVLIALVLVFLVLVGLGIARRIARGGSVRRPISAPATSPSPYVGQMGYKVTVPAGWGVEHEPLRQLDRIGPPGGQTAVSIKKMPAGNDVSSASDSALLAAVKKDVGAPSQYSVDDASFKIDRSASYAGNAAIALTFDLVDSSRQVKLTGRLYRFTAGGGQWAVLEQAPPGDLAASKDDFSTIQVSFAPA